MNQSRVLKNVVFGFGGQVISIVIGLIVPHIMIKSYGSDVNGLMSTITQIFSYMALLEAGIGQASRNALFKPITEGNKDAISYVLSVSRHYFRKVVVFYAIAVSLLAVSAPFILKTTVDHVTVFWVVILEGMSGVVSFYFISTITTMLGADGRGYINNNITVLNKMIGYAVKIYMAYLGMNIVYLQSVFFLITVAKVIFYRFYFKKYYGWVDYSAAPKSVRLKDRNSYIITEIAWTMFSSTDMIVISAFLSTKLSSVYAVYHMVFSGLNTLLNAVYGNVSYLLGQAYHENIHKYEKVHDAFISIFFGGMTILVSVAYLLCIPFVQLYTRGITDIDYIYHWLPLLFSLVQLISWSRYIGGNLTGVAGYAKETSWVSLIEALINIVLSVALVNRYGIVGVLLATVLALPLKVLWCIYISDKKVLHRSYWKTWKILSINYLIFIGVVIVNQFVDITINSYLQFFGWGIVFSIIFSLIGIALNLAVNPHCLHMIVKLFRKNRGML